MILFENTTKPMCLSGEVDILGRTSGYPLHITEDGGRLVLRIDAAILARRARAARLGSWLAARGGVWGWLSRWLFDDPVPGMPEGVIHFRDTAQVEVLGLYVYGGHASRATCYAESLEDHPAHPSTPE